MRTVVVEINRGQVEASVLGFDLWELRLQSFELRLSMCPVSGVRYRSCQVVKWRIEEVVDQIPCCYTLLRCGMMRVFEKTCLIST